MKKLILRAIRRLENAFAHSGSNNETVYYKTAIRKIDEWIESKGYCSTDMPISKLCNLLEISRYELSWVCRTVYEDSFPGLRKKLRIYEAERLLVSRPEMPFSHIGEKVGIPDRTNFRRQFMEITGMTPRDYRDSHLK